MKTLGMGKKAGGNLAIFQCLKRAKDGLFKASSLRQPVLQLSQKMFGIGGILSFIATSSAS